jgi:FlaA1/EpsC-like NDP-sugar epimerase
VLPSVIVARAADSPLGRGRSPVRTRFGTLVERLFPYKRPIVVVGHIVLFLASYLAVFILRFEGGIPPDLWIFFLRTVPLLVAIRVVVFALFRVHEGLWRYVGIRDLVDIFKAVSVSSACFVAVLLGLYGVDFPRSVVLFDWLVCFGLVAGLRVFIRILRESSPSLMESARRALVVGAGDAGERLIREIDHNTELNYFVVGIVDDSPRLQRKRIHGVQVLGVVDSIPALCRERGVDEVVLAVPSATEAQRGRIITHCRRAGVVVRTVPSVMDLWTGRAGIGNLQKVAPEDLLGRKKVEVDMVRLQDQVGGRTVMVTGAGGSIGSELCRQLATLKPATLVAFDQAETNLFWLQLELQRSNSDVQVVPIVGDILDSHRVNEVMKFHRPAAVYHAAAYKHVPMMEQNTLEAIRNNVFGTETVAAAAEENGVDRFVLISTDKAVHPISIMGMSKRVAEDLLISRNGSSTSHITVRFGNVLGSAGSVMPLFQWQMGVGGPVTVTDTEATRYFMLIVEAAQLVLQAAAMGRGGEVFMLDMGTPVPVLQLAEDLMRLSGVYPSDISVEMVGLRPGEKLREELMHETEKFLPSDHDQIFVSVDAKFDRNHFQSTLTELRQAVGDGDEREARRILRSLCERSILQPASGTTEN